MMNDEAECKKLWRVRCTIMQMCHDRGYIVTQKELEETFEEFKEKFGDKPSEKQPARSDLNVLVAHKDDATDLFVFFLDEDKAGTKDIRTIFRQMQEKNVFKAIIVLKNTITPQAKCLVPEHVLMKPEEQTELLNRYKMKENELMRILANDPVARYYGLKKGQVSNASSDVLLLFYFSVAYFSSYSQVVKIIRKSETAGRYITYRHVV
ncbi:DNA-directed RNA polymerases I, II, and III subunit RPABC1-like isoform X5 [Argiope bruennichi]|uniref:DNA-directed RNA polymerases I, II, and III subunit RPABC1-like isoform X5 n=1 Tax=Argiope bruennichi TaxID=94029 RepID=UPI002493E71C|nr:DNA-directed RNA polymerases I, II, and III subunit RPABC1-like isoform X5 [Argiope bruennichi]